VSIPNSPATALATGHASRSKDILADIINVGIEALVHARYELPAFSTLRRAAQKARAQINHGYSHQVHAALDDVQRATIQRLLSRDDQEGASPWQRLKREPKRPTTKRSREHLAHVRWLQSVNTARHALDGIPETKLYLRPRAGAWRSTVSRAPEVDLWC
jgi:hypothetical protein